MKLICDYPFTHFEINNPDGDVTFCCNHNMVMGNINDNTIEEIWNSDKYQEVRKKFLDGKIFDICYKSCPVLNGWKDYEKLDWYKNLPEDSEPYKNAVLNEKEIFDGKTVLKSQPRWIRFATSYRCNLKCYHCFQDITKQKTDKLPESFFNEIKENYLMVLQIIFFYGGEPLIEKKNIEILKYISMNNFLVKIFLVTNGTVLNDELKDIFRKINLGMVSVSIDSIKPELYEELRYPADFENVEKNLKFFSEIADSKKFEFHLGGTINKKNYLEISQYIDYSLKLKAIPLFQLAGNSLRNKTFRREYEIFYPDDFIQLKGRLNNVYEEIKKNPVVSRYTLLNIKNLIDLCSLKIEENKRLNRLQRFINRKKRIYWNIIRRLFSKKEKR